MWKLITVAALLFVYVNNACLCCTGGFGVCESASEDGYSFQAMDDFQAEYVYPHVGKAKHCLKQPFLLTEKIFAAFLAVFCVSDVLSDLLFTYHPATVLLRRIRSPDFVDVAKCNKCNSSF